MFLKKKRGYSLLMLKIRNELTDALHHYLANSDEQFLTISVCLQAKKTRLFTFDAENK